MRGSRSVGFVRAAALLSFMGALHAGLSVSGPVVRGSAQALPTGRWEAIANGDDILCAARQGDVLWAGTRAGGLVRWDLTDGTYEQYLRPQDPIGGNTVVDIAIDGAGRKWLATEWGLSVLDDGGTAGRADDVWRTYTVAGTSGGLPSDDVRAVAIDGDLVWVGGAQERDPVTGIWSGGGLGRLDTRGTPATADDVWAPIATFAGTTRTSPLNERLLGLVSDNVSDIVVTPGRDLWVATGPHWLLEEPPMPELDSEWGRRHGGISFLDTGATSDPADDVWTANDCEKFQVTVTCSVQAMALDADGIMWAAIAGRGVVWFPADTGAIIDERARRIDLEGGSEEDFVDAIAFGPTDDPDLADTVWLGRRRGGLSVLDHQGTLRSRGDDVWDFDRGGPLTSADGLTVDRVQAIVVSSDGAWLGLGSGYGRPGGLTPVSVVDLAPGEPLRTSNAPPTNFITEIAFGEAGTRWEGHVWLGTGSRSQRLFGVGAVDLDLGGTLDRSDDVWTSYDKASTDDDGRAPWAGLAGDNVVAASVKGDRVWLGSTESTWDQAAGRYSDGGLAVFDGERWTARTPANTGGPAKGLGSGSVSALAGGCSGELWVGTGNGWDYWGAGVDVLTPGASVHDRTADTWARHSYPRLASNSTTGIAMDCDAGRAWVTGEHHVTRGNPSTGGGGDRVGGGVAELDLASGAWTRHGKAEGFDSYSRDYITGEATSLAVALDGTVWVGGYGTRELTTAQLVSLAPFYPAVVNSRAFGAGAWTSRVFDRAGEVASLAVDPNGRVWAATGRGGAARDSARAENWRHDRIDGGLMVYDGGTWSRLDARQSGLPGNDLSEVAIAPDGTVWVAGEGWGLARYLIGEPPPTPTATSDAPTPTASPTRTATRTPTGAEATPTGGTPGGSPTATRATFPDEVQAYLPYADRPSRGVLRSRVLLPMVTTGAGRR